MDLGRVSTDIYNELNRQKLLDSDIGSHSLFDKNNCSTVIQSALTAAMTLLQKKASLDDKSHRNRRKHPEAGAEVLAMNARLTDAKKSTKRERMLAAESNGAANRHNIDDRSKKQMCEHVLLKKSRGNKDKLTTDDRTFIQACALVLTNGQKLNDHSIKKRIEEAKKSFTDKRTNPRKRPREEAQEDDESYCPKDEICPVANCSKVLKLNNATGRYFQQCFNCFQDLKNGKDLTMKNGHVVKSRQATTWMHDGRISPGG